jgi:RHS repeat-associated protein
MGCLKLTYYQKHKPLEVKRDFFTDALGKKRDAEENYLSSYSFGFQGQVRDDDIKGVGNSINFKYRMHDPRLGRFFAVDPLFRKYPELSTYQFSSLNPIGMLEIEGLEGSLQKQQRQQNKRTRQRLRIQKRTERTAKRNGETYTPASAFANIWTKGKTRTLSSGTPQNYTSTGTGFSYPANTWPCMVTESVDQSDEANPKLVVTRIGFYNTDKKREEWGPDTDYPGKRITLDENTGNVLSPETGEVLYEKPESIVVRHDELKEGATNTGGKVYDGSDSIRKKSVEKTEQVIIEQEDIDGN